MARAVKVLVLIMVLMAFGHPALSAPKASKKIQAANAAALIFGPEWTFTNRELLALHDFEVIQKMPEIYEAFVRHCRLTKRCKATVDSEGNKIINFNGFEVYLAYDAGVIEMQSSPISQAEWRKKIDLLQENVFDVLGSMGYFPHSHIGNGHLNMGLQYFADKPMLLRNFIVDFFNHPGLSIVLNTYNENLRNSQTFDQWIPRDQDRFREALQQLDAIPDFTIRDVLEKLNPSLREKYIALAMREVILYSWDQSDKLDSEARLEIRSLRPQANMTDFLKVIQIFESRVDYLSTLARPVPFQPPPRTKNGLEALGQYAEYLEESGLKLKDFKSLLPAEWRQISKKQYAEPLMSYQKAHQCQKTQSLLLIRAGR